MYKIFFSNYSHIISVKYFLLKKKSFIIIFSVEEEFGGLAEESLVMEMTATSMTPELNISSTETPINNLIEFIEEECQTCVIPTIVFSSIGVFLIIIGIYYLIKENHRRRRTHKFINTNNSRTHLNAIDIIYQ